ncbi:hypothetical protein [Sphaerisporangium album]|nr:hypothetical protein [Sphaerisporangium album]
MSEVRGGDGRYHRDPRTAKRDAEACRLRARGYTYEQIAVELKMSGKGRAYDAVQRALADTVREPAEEVRQLEVLRLDELYRAALAVMENTHYVVSHGKIVRLGEPYIDDDGEAAVDDDQGAPLVDDAPVLAAIDRMLRIQERRARLLGLDSPQRVSIDAQNLGDDIRGLISALTGEDDDDDADEEEPDETG